MNQSNNYKVIIIGSGFGGQIAAINLLKREIHDFKILERREFMGGTWVQNTYPGAAVDVQSPLYSISSEPYKWKKMFSEQEELNAYTNYVIEKHGLRAKTDTKTNVEQLKWNEEEKKWQISTSNKTYFGKYIINASGPLSTPVIPNFKGKDTFKGKSFHTNHWDHDYDYKDKRVAIIGTGASSAQIIPAIANDTKHLSVFQRTPHWVLPRPDMDFPKPVQALLGIKPLYNVLRYGIYWSLESRVIGFKYSDKLLELIAQKKSENFIEAQIENEEVRRKVTPDYRIGCKRIILSNTLLKTLDRSNVSLYDKNQGIKEIMEDGIITVEDEKVELDLIIYSTGYDATDGVISYDVIGKKDKKLQDFWADFPRAYLGTTIPDFPNLFVVTGPNTGIGHTSAIFIIESQMEYIMNAISTVEKKNKSSIEVNKEAEEKYTENIHKEMKKTVWSYGGCSSWYQSKSGKVIAMFPGFSFTYRQMAKRLKMKDHILN